MFPRTAACRRLGGKGGASGDGACLNLRVTASELGMVPPSLLPSQDAPVYVAAAVSSENAMREREEVREQRGVG